MKASLGSRAFAYAYNCCFNASLLWIFSVSLDYLFLSTYFVKCRRNLNGVEFQGTIFKFKSEKKNKFRRCLFTLSIKSKIRHLHVVVVQKWQRNAKIKAWCTCKVVVLLIKPIVLLKFSLPSCRWIFVVITWTRMLEGKANGCSQWFLSATRSVVSNLEKALLVGHINCGFKAKVIWIIYPILEARSLIF